MSARRQPQKASACPSARHTGGTTSAVPLAHLPAFPQLQPGNNAPASVRDTVITQNAATLRHKGQQPKDQGLQPGDQLLQPDDQEQQQGEHKLQQEDQGIPQQGEQQQDQEIPRQEEQQDLPGLSLRGLGKHQDQQQQGELQDHQDQGPRLEDQPLRKGQAFLLLWLPHARLTVLKPSEAERLWRSASSTRMSMTTATTRNAPRNAGAPPVEGKRIQTAGSTWETGSVTFLPPLARLSAKRMQRSGFARPNARSLKATLTAAPLPVLPSVQTKGGKK